MKERCKVPTDVQLPGVEDMVELSVDPVLLRLSAVSLSLSDETSIWRLPSRQVLACTRPSIRSESSANTRLLMEDLSETWRKMLGAEE